MPPGLPPSAAPRSGPSWSLDEAVRLAGLAALLLLVFILLRPIATILVWSSVIAVLIFPLFTWVRDRLGRRVTLSATVVTLLALLLVLGPVAAIISDVVVSLEALARAIRQDGWTLPSPPPAWRDSPWLAWAGNVPDLTPERVQAYLEQHEKALIGTGEHVLRLVEHLTGSIAFLAVSVVIAGALLVSSASIGERAEAIALRLFGGARGGRVLVLVGATIRDVARGIIGIAVFQALATWAVLAVAGVPHAGGLTLAVLVLSIAQIGGWLVVVPVTIWGWMTNDPLWAAMLTIALLAVGAVEHVLKPVVMGRGTGTPAIVVLVGVVTGTLAFGLPGLFVGPVVLAVFFELLTAWSEPEVDDADPVPPG
jgi:predicted PurR-regulated permease PerM